ncbi:hypothetical protein [Providencia sp. PROV172]|uniref:hypothetical protein n=1 Tax=Providencia sp. PROV172 TaxID=2949876 RepID=UPI00234B9E88|nr:hypothetical protein [Providencia sp. PROV172]
MQKYRITDIEKNHDGITLYKIENLITKEYGGWVSSESNLSQEGNCFILDDAMVYGNAHISGDAQISGNACICDDAKVYDNAMVYGNALISDNANIYGNAKVSDNASVSGNSKVLDKSDIFDNAKVSGNAELRGRCLIMNSAEISEFAQITGKDYTAVIIKDSAKVYGNAIVTNNSIISGHAEVYDNARILISCQVTNYAKVYENATVEGSPLISENAQVYGNALIRNNAIIRGNARVYGNASINLGTVIEGNDYVSGICYWEDIHSLSALKIFIPGGGKAASIYANGNHQVQVEINIEAKNNHNQPLDISPKDIFKNIQLVDYKNEPFSNVLHYTDICGNYAPNSGTSNKQVNISSCIVYVSLNHLIEAFKLCVRCQINQDEYTTALEYNGKNKMPDYVLLNVLPKRIFSESDLDKYSLEHPIIEKGVGGYSNSILTKYYVRFNNTNGTITHDASCQEHLWFHYKQTGNYKGCSTSTDSSVKQNHDAAYTTTFHFTQKWSITVTSKNHEKSGLCFWSYRVWYGALWNYSEWGEKMAFILRDQYGNEATIIAKVGNDEHIKFYVS